MVAILFILSLTLTSYCSYTNIVKNGVKGNSQTAKWNQHVADYLESIRFFDLMVMVMVNSTKYHTTQTRL